MDIDNINVLVLAYLGDSVYETIIRNYLVKTGIANINDLHTAALQFSPAKRQAIFIHEMLDKHLLTDDEEALVMRARNHKSAHPTKTSTVSEYKYATGLEALIGYLYLQGNNNRIQEIMKYVLERGINELS